MIRTIDDVIREAIPTMSAEDALEAIMMWVRAANDDETKLKNIREIAEGVLLHLKR